MSTWLDPLRETSFPQKWTIYYWSYWMVWCVATPFFIGSISKGRTIKNTVLGGYAWGIAGTFTAFIILGNYGLAQQLKHGLDITGILNTNADYAAAILKIFETMPLANIGLLLLAVTMIAFYATTFDALTLVVSAYSSLLRVVLIPVLTDSLANYYSTVFIFTIFWFTILKNNVTRFSLCAPLL